ncbi:MAG: ASKHA domain-containing protein [Lachnospiraceae bacterium]|nr:ASKHA domain-containing protein [Lachnospiraceae bacterium]
MITIQFQPVGCRISVAEGTTLMEAALSAGIPLNAACGGGGTCGKCRVQVKQEAFSGMSSEKLESELQDTSSVIPVSEEERRLLTIQELGSGIRLACMTRAFKDLTVILPETAGSDSQIILTQGSIPKGRNKDRPDVTATENKANSNIEFHESENAMSAVTMSDTAMYGAAIDIGTTTLAAYLYELSTGVRVAESSMMNPQISWGEDVISRITCCQQREDGLSLLSSKLRDALQQLLLQMSEKSGISMEMIRDTVFVGNTVMIHILMGISPECLGHAPFQPIVKDSVDMAASELGLSVHPDGRVRILPAADGFVGADHIATLLAADGFLQEKLAQETNNLNRPVDAFTERNIEQQDTPLSEGILDQKETTGTTLVIDIGTNSEICLATEGQLYVTSCATGPALEGAQIRYGMRGAAGAIDHVRINPKTLEPTIHVIGEEQKFAEIQDFPSDDIEQKYNETPDYFVRSTENSPLGICGSGIVDAVAEMAVTGILTPEGAFAPGIESDRIRLNEQQEKEYILWEDPEEQKAEKSSVTARRERNPEESFPGKTTGSSKKSRSVTVSQQDVRAVQLAKAALYAGIKLLFQKSGVKQVDRILLAGGFGCYLDVNHALMLGLFPDCAPEKVIPLGNAAGMGAIQALLNPDSWSRAQNLVRQIRFVDSTAAPEFPMLYADAMMIPHKRDGFPVSRPVVWNCPGNDTRFLPDWIFENPLSCLEDSKEQILMLKELLKEEHKEEQKSSFYTKQSTENNTGHEPCVKVGGEMVTNHLTLPLLQNLEACAYGALPEKKAGYWAPGAYPFRSVEEVLDTPLDLLNDSRIQAVLEVISAFPQEQLILEVEAPFTILTALVDPRAVFAALRRSPEQVQKLLKRLADQEALYIGEAIKRGCTVFSLADPLGTAELNGKKLYREIIGPSQVYLLKRCRRYLKQGLIHVCGRMSAELVREGFARAFPVRVERNKYVDALFSLAPQERIRTVGMGCIHSGVLQEPILQGLELLKN